MNEAVFEAKLLAMFPEIVDSGVVSRAQITSTMEELGTTKYPNWLMVNKVGRGLYAINGNAVRKEVVEQEPTEKLVKSNYVTEATVAPPLVDPNYVAWGNHSDVDAIIKSKLFHPIYITGPTGNGKSTMVEQICAKHKKPLIRVNLNMMTDEDQLIGSKTLENGNVEIVEGPVLIAMRNGTTLLLDEIDAGSANTLLCLQPILEGKPYYFKLKNEMITPATGFNVIATACHCRQSTLGQCP